MKIIKRNTGDILGGASVRHANHWLLYSCVVMPHATLSLNYIKPIFDEIVKRHTHTHFTTARSSTIQKFSVDIQPSHENIAIRHERKTHCQYFHSMFFFLFFFCQFQTGRSLYSRCWFTFIGRICSQVHSYILVRVRVIIAYSTAHRIALIL